MKLKHSFLIACLGSAPLCAQQQVQNQKAEVQKSEQTESTSNNRSASTSATATANGNGITKSETRTSDSKNGRQHHRAQPGQPNNAPPQVQGQKPVPYIGVLTREVPPELRAQFSLPEGFGLMVEEVMPDSPAEKAGIKVHDVLLKFEDQQLVSMEQLMLLVRSKHKGDSVNLTMISGGRENQVAVILGEHLMAVNQPRQQQNFVNGWPQHGMQVFNGGNWQPFQDQGRQLNDQMQRFQKEMQEYQRRIQDWARQNNGGPMPQPPNFNMPGKPQSRGGQVNGGVQMPPQANGNNAQQFNFSEVHAATNITRRDDSGEYSLQREDGKTTFIARPNNGKEQSWPVNSDEERKAVPEEFRDKLRMMDGPNSNIRIQINPGLENIEGPHGPGGGVAPQPGPAGPANGGKPQKPTTSA